LETQRETDAPNGRNEGSTPNEEVNDDDQPLQFYQKIVIFFAILLAIALLVFLHWFVAKVLALFMGSFLSKIAIFCGYWYLIKAAVRYFAFPGSF